MRHSVEEYEISRMDHDGYTEPPVSTLEEYPAYIAQEVNESIEKIQSLQGMNTVSFGFLTDTHYAVRLKATHQIRFRRTINAYKEIAKRVHLDFLGMGGDHVNDGDKQYKKDCYRGLRAELAGVRYFPVNGNHDDNSIWDISFIPSEISTQHLTREERYPLFYNHAPAQGAIFNYENRGLYYYWDNVDVKVRFIFLDSNDIPYIYDNGKLRYYHQGDYSYSQAQLDWLVNKALRFEEEGWTVVLMQHVPPFGKGENLSRLAVVHDILKAYKNGEKCFVDRGQGTDFPQKVDVDFGTYLRGEIACMMLGHSHVDRANQADGIWYIETGCGIMYVGGPHSIQRKDGDKTELVFDIVTIDLDKKKVFLTRVGAGEDREFTY